MIQKQRPATQGPGPLIRAALKNPHLIAVIALAVVVVGVTSYQRIPPSRRFKP